MKLFINPIATIIDHIIRNDHEVNEAFEIIPGTSMNAIYPIATTIKKTKQLTTNMKQIEDRQTSYSKYLNPSKWNHAYFLFEQDFYAEIDYDYLYKYLARGYTVDNIGRKTFTGYTSKF